MISNCDKFKEMVYEWKSTEYVTYGFSRPIAGFETGYSLFNYDSLHKSILIHLFHFSENDKSTPNWGCKIYDDEQEAISALNTTLLNLKRWDEYLRIKQMYEDF